MGGGGQGQTIERPKNHHRGLSRKRQRGYQAEATMKKSSWPSNWPGRIAIMAR